jgi:hypothetical protein
VAIAIFTGADLLLRVDRPRLGPFSGLVLADPRVVRHAEITQVLLDGEDFVAQGSQVALQLCCG